MSATPPDRTRFGREVHGALAGQTNAKGEATLMHETAAQEMK